jgi:hypothetical protein
VSQDLAALLANGLPTGLYGAGIHPQSLTRDNHVCTFTGSVAKPKFSPNGDLVLEFRVSRPHRYIALPIADLSAYRLMVSVHVESDRVREQYGAQIANGESFPDHQLPDLHTTPVPGIPAVQVVEAARDRRLEVKVRRALRGCYVRTKDPIEDTAGPNVRPVH